MNSAHGNVLNWRLEHDHWVSAVVHI
jgi:hypothetical protein